MSELTPQEIITEGTKCLMNEMEQFTAGLLTMSMAYSFMLQAADKIGMSHNQVYGGLIDLITDIEIDFERAQYSSLMEVVKENALVFYTETKEAIDFAEQIWERAIQAHEDCTKVEHKLRSALKEYNKDAKGKHGTCLCANNDGCNCASDTGNLCHNHK